MPTVSLNECGVVVRGCDSSIPSIRISLSLGSEDEGSGADMGVNDEYGCDREASPVADPKARGDSISPGGLCGFSSSSAGGLTRFFLPEEDSWGSSAGVCCGVVAPTGGGPAWPGGVCIWGASVWGCCCSTELTVGLGFLGGGYTSPRAAASCARCCASALVGLPRFFLLAGSATGDMAAV